MDFLVKAMIFAVALTVVPAFLYAGLALFLMAVAAIVNKFSKDESQ